MDGFKSLPKMQCFREGGSVKSKPVAKCYGGKMKEGGKADLAQDKKVIKKAFAMHDKQEHKGEKTDLSTLKKGGRAKKAVGTVKKFKCGGGVFGAKKTKEDIKNMDAAKTCKPKKLSNGGSALKETDAEENPGLAKLPTNVRNKMGYAKKGGKVAKKMAVGGQPGATEAQQKYYNKNKADAKVKEDKAMYEAVGSRGDAARKGMAEGRMDQMGNAFKKGGKAKVKKFAKGGSTGELSSEEKAWLGGADATDPFILARMRSALGPKKPQGSYIPNADPTMDNRDVGMAKPYQAPNVEQDSGLAYPQENELRTAPMAPRPVARPAAKQNDIPNSKPWADNRDIGGKRFSFSSGVTPLSGKSYNDLPRETIGYQAPNVEQDSGLEYPIKPTFTTATPGQQATQFNKGVEARKNVGRRLGEFLGFNKKPVS
jgi:hypothetical protein